MIETSKNESTAVTNPKISVMASSQSDSLHVKELRYNAKSSPQLLADDHPIIANTVKPGLGP